MKIFLTGGTGLLGSNIVNELLVKHYQIKLLVRPNSNGKKYNNKDVEIVYGDLNDIKSFTPELTGCEVVIHAGAYFTEFFKEGSDKDLLNEINVKGTMLLFEEAYKAGIKNIIYISSSGVFDTSGSDIIDESTSYAENKDNPYFRSKTEAEKQVLKFAEVHPSMRIITISPALMMGPGDKGPTRMGEFVLNFLKGKMPAVLPVKMVFADARDVAKATVAAMDKGNSGERYLIGGNVYEMIEVIKMLSEVSGKPIPRIRPSLKVSMVLSGIMSFVSKITGKPSAIPNRSELHRMSTQKGYSSQKAKKEFGLKFHTLSETISTTVNWYDQNGYIQ